MRLFGTRAPTVDTGQEPLAPQRNPLQVLRADGQRIDLSNRDTGSLLVATRQPWQQLAFSYRDLIGELRYAIRLLSRSVARARFYPAQIKPWPEDPAALDSDEHDLDKQLAADAMHNFGRLPMDGNPDGFTARLVENLTIAGEAWVHLDPTERFWIRSTSEITVGGDGKVYLSTLPTATSGSRRIIDSATEDLMRMWVPHPEWGQLADSPLRCLMDTAEDVVLAGREQRAAARSRVAANGILLMPSTLSLVRSRDDDDDHDDSITSDTFMADFTAAMLAPIRDDGDAQAVVPIVIRGEIDDLKEVRHVVLQRADADHLIRRQEAAIMRLLRGMDVQPEQVQGLGAGNHWCVDDQTEALTTRGWVKHGDLRVGDLALTLNHETGLSEWQPVIDIYRAQVVDESMVSIEGRRHSSLTTSNHRWPVLTMHGSDWTTSGSLFVETTTMYRGAEQVRVRRERALVLRAEGWTYQRIGAELGVSMEMAWRYVNLPGIGSRREVKRSSGSRSEKFLLLAAPHMGLPAQPKYDDALVELVAWFFTEGSAAERPGRRTPKVTIYQSYEVNPDNVARIRRALTNLFGPESAQLDKGGRYTTSESVARRLRARELYGKGWTIASIAGHLGVSTTMVGKYLRLDAKPGPQGPKWRERRSRRGMSAFVLNSDAARVVLEHAPKRVVAHEFVTALTASQLELFLDTAIRGDGSRQARGTGTPTIAQKDPAMLDAMETAAILAGYSVMRYTMTGEGRSASGPRIRTLHCLSFTSSPLRTKYAPGASSVTETVYTGTVWCPVTSNGTWCARRRGTVYYTGNSSWLVEAAAIQHQVQPMAETVAACLFQAFLRPALETLGHDPADIAQITIAVDVSELAENPNRGQDAATAHDKEVISDEALRQALGFDEDDAPDEFELIRRSLTKGRITPQAIPLIIRALDRQLPTAQDIANATGQTMPHPVVIDGQPQLPPAKAQPVATPGQVTPNQPVPQPPAGTPVVASGAPSDVLVDRISVAADAAVARVLERAGARLRSAVQRTDRAAGGALAGVDPHLIPARLGRARVEMFAAVPDLIADDYSRLQGQVSRWSTDDGHIDDGSSVTWANLIGLLNTAAERALFAPADNGDLLVSPTEVRQALTTTEAHVQ